MILDGFNSHWIAYGQTGSGKSHTMIGPMGVFDTAAESIDDVHPHLGLFPRAAMILLKGIQQKPEKTVMTICIAESPWRDPMDLVTKQMIMLDTVSSDLIGMKETVIRGPADIYKMGRVLQQERTTNATKFNATSSRTHCLMWFKIYTKTGDN